MRGNSTRVCVPEMAGVGGMAEMVQMAITAEMVGGHWGEIKRRGHSDERKKTKGHKKKGQKVGGKK